MINIIIPTLDIIQGYNVGDVAQATAGIETRLSVVLDKNREGFTKTVNQGMRTWPDGDVCLLNDDVSAFPMGWLANLYRTLRRRGVGIVCPSGNSSTRPMCDGAAGMFGVVEVKQIPFWCCVIKRSLIDKIGYLDERYIHYASDNDYCDRARAAGFKLVWMRDVFLTHRQHGSGQIQEWKRHDQRLYRRGGKR